MKAGEKYEITNGDIFLYEHENGDIIHVQKINKTLVEYTFKGNIYYTSKNKIKHGSIKQNECDLSPQRKANRPKSKRE